MADTKIDVKELPNEGLSRVFNRIDSVEVSPALIYDSNDIDTDDRAVFFVKPADPITRDKLKEVVMTMSTLQGSVCDSYGISVTDMTSDAIKKAKGKKKESILRAFQDLQAFNRYEMASESTRELLSSCVTKIDNFKVLEKKKLVESKLSAKDIIMTMPDILVEWLFNEVQELSNLTMSEVLGV